MILTVTLNPSVDISYQLDTFQVDGVNRVEHVRKSAGGKGLNVSRVLKQLGADVAATGFLGGSLGGFIRQQLTELAIVDHFVACDGDTRNCIAVIHNGQQTEILEGGPTITAEKALFLQRFQSSVEKAEIITISGSLPKGLASNFYDELLKIAAEVGKPVLLDTSGEALKQALTAEQKPFLIKPNEEELSGLINEEIEQEEALITALNHALFDEVSWVVVTLGANGALVKHNGQVYRVDIPVVEVVNPVGSGDSVVAGFAHGLSMKLPVEALIQYGITMGLLNAMEVQTGAIDPTKIDEYAAKIIVTAL